MGVRDSIIVEGGLGVGMGGEQSMGELRFGLVEDFIILNFSHVM